MILMDQSSMAVVLHIKSYMAVCKNQKTEAEFRVFILIVILWQVQDLLNSDRFYFIGLQNHCGWGLQPWKAMTNLDSVLKTRAITWLTKVCIVKAMVIPVVMYGCERRLSAKELMLSNCGAGEDSLRAWESRGLQGDQTSQS